MSDETAEWSLAVNITTTRGPGEVVDVVKRALGPLVGGIAHVRVTRPDTPRHVRLGAALRATDDVQEAIEHLGSLDYRLAMIAVAFPDVADQAQDVAMQARIMQQRAIGLSHELRGLADRISREDD